MTSTGQNNKLNYFEAHFEKRVFSLEVLKLNKVSSHVRW